MRHQASTGTRRHDRLATQMQSPAVERIVDALHAEGCKIVMTTHDMNQARRLADEVIFLHGGKLVERAEAADFFDRPRSEVATAFLEGRLLW